MDASASVDRADTDGLVHVVLDNGSYTFTAGKACDGPPLVSERNVFAEYTGSGVQLPGHSRQAFGESALRGGGFNRHHRPALAGSLHDTRALYEWLQWVRKQHLDNVPLNRLVLHVLCAFADGSAECREEARYREWGAQEEVHDVVCWPIYSSYVSFAARCGEGEQTALLVDVGHASSRIVPVQNGRVLHHAVRETGAAGALVTEELFAALRRRGVQVNSDHRTRFRLHELKTSLCVAQDYEAERDTHTQHPMSVQWDGEEISLGEEVVRCAECLFSREHSYFPIVTPEGQEEGESSGWNEVRRVGGVMPIHEAIHSAVAAIGEAAVRRELYSRVLVIGGGARLRGFSSRLQHELSTSAPELGSRVAVGRVAISAWQAAAEMVLCRDGVLRSPAHAWAFGSSDRCCGVGTTK
eukprot:TRINITY_DN25741_c0_g1_i1.p1 TRINITY_DN25741_c0_g1~~TRINITY_DN25741_c0_g1_i1.p1  ORF type:complete len:412 (+),score=104.22 TRINITY_DN25741_c0_g1_i1:2-1237(+)